MNKGIRLATGEIIGIVNSDDCLYPDALDNVVRQFTGQPDTGFTYGCVDRIDANGNLYGKKVPLSEESIDSRKNRLMPFPHLSLFVAREVYQTVGLFDPSFKVSADYDFALRLLDRDIKGVRMNETVGMFRIEGQSGGLQTFLETRRIHRKHGVSVWLREWNFISSIVKIFTAAILPARVLRYFKQFRKDSVNRLQ